MEVDDGKGGGREEMVDAKADSSGMSWTVAMAVGCGRCKVWRWTDVVRDGRVGEGEGGGGGFIMQEVLVTSNS
jgi:hypothetical protein